MTEEILDKEMADETLQKDFSKMTEIELNEWWHQNANNFPEWESVRGRIMQLAKDNPEGFEDSIKLIQKIAAGE